MHRPLSRGSQPSCQSLAVERLRSVTVPTRLPRDLAAKHPVHKDEVADRQRHPEAPPDQADRQRVIARMRVIDRDVQAGSVVDTSRFG